MASPAHVIHDIVRGRDMLCRFAEGNFNKYDKYAISMILMRQPSADDLANIQTAAINELGESYEAFKIN